MPSKHRDILGPKDRDIGKEIDREKPSPAVKRAVARDLDEHADDPIHASDEPVKPDSEDDDERKRKPLKH